MAAAGACIVMTGLTVLSIIISFFPKIFKLLEPDTPEKESVEENVIEKSAEPQHDLNTILSGDITEAAKSLALLAPKLGQSFELKTLFSFLRENDVTNPHMVVRELRQQNCLVPSGENLFSWNL
jgi:hypothetical protein